MAQQSYDPLLLTVNFLYSSIVLLLTTMNPTSVPPEIHVILTKIL